MHNAHVIEHLQGARGWHDGTLEADHWTALGDIAPIDAAMLLCRFNPNAESYDDARQSTTDELGPEHLVRLAQRLSDIDKAEHKPRTLRDWHQTTRGLGLTYHSWIDGYMEATTPLAPPVVDTTPPEPQAAPVVKVVKRTKRNTWRDVALDYMTRVYREGQYATAKDFFDALMKKAGTDSPFDVGVGANRGNLFVRDIGKGLPLKTLENAMPEIRAAQE